MGQRVRRGLLVLGFGAALTAHASKRYPDEIQRHLTACSIPPCVVCHQTARGGSGTANRPFAITMQNAGLTGNGSYTTLRNALDAVEADGTDSDNDGSGDVVELRLGTNPSDAT